MPKILTNTYAEAEFFIPYTADKSEGVYAVPITETRRNEIRRAVIQEAGQDEEIAGLLLTKHILKECLRGWKGFFDATGTEIPFSDDVIGDICKHDPEFVSSLSMRIANIARFGELVEEKN